MALDNQQWRRGSSRWRRLPRSFQRDRTGVSRRPLYKVEARKRRPVATDRSKTSYCKRHPLVVYIRVSDAKGEASTFCPSCWLKHYTTAPPEIQQALREREDRLRVKK